jgi:HD-like signal output (HDOD) protein
MNNIFSNFKKIFRRREQVNPSQSRQASRSTNQPISSAHHPHKNDAQKINLAFYAILFPSTTAKAPLTAPQKLVLNVVIDNLKKGGQHLRSVPRLPSIIPRLLKSLRDPEASANDFVKIINKDPAMSTAVLKRANSMYFNPHGQTINSIEQGVVKLGIEGLRSVLSTAVMQPVIQYKSSYFSGFGRTLWEHSLCCAVCCEVNAKKQGLEPFKAYLLGLVHDMGKLTIFSELCAQFKLNPGQKPPNYQAFAPLMQSMSTKLSYQIALNWELPEEICTALEQQVSCNTEHEMEVYGRLLFQSNLVCEAFAARQQNEDEAGRVETSDCEALIKQFSMPENLFETLNLLSL